MNLTWGRASDLVEIVLDYLDSDGVLRAAKRLSQIRHKLHTVNDYHTAQMSPRTAALLAEEKRLVNVIEASPRAIPEGTEKTMTSDYYDEVSKDQFGGRKLGSTPARKLLL